MAGYLILFICFAFFLAKKDARFIVLIALGIVLFLTLPGIDWGSDKINQFVSRFAITENGFAGDNRTNEQFDLYYEQFKNKKDYLWGAKELPDFYQISSYKTHILKYGIIRYMLWILTWIISALKIAKSNKTCLLFCFVFLISIYQRPGVIESIYGYVLLFGGLEWIQSEQAAEDIQCESAIKMSDT